VFETVKVFQMIKASWDTQSAYKIL